MYGDIIKNIYFPLIKNFTDVDICSAYEELKACQWKSKEELEERSWKKMKYILKYSYDNIPIYRKKFDDVGITPGDIKNRDDLLKLPVIRKDDFRNNFPDGVLSKVISSDRYVYDHTSGSTGAPFLFVRDKNATGKTIASNMLLFEWAGLKIGMRSARVWGIFDRSLQTMLWERFIRRRMTIDAFQIRKHNIDNFIQKLENYNPVSILGYTASMVKLSKHIESMEKRPVFNNLCSVIVMAETLTEDGRTSIQDNFGCKVFNSYGSREIPNIAQECENQKGLHINTDNVFLEVIKDDGHASYGEKGEIVVTDLNNFAMPFIRYSMGDIGSLIEEQCPCKMGFPLLKSVEGRINDNIKLPSGNIITSMYFYMNFGMNYADFVKQFQVIQNRSDQLIINISPTENYNDPIGEKIRNEILNDIGTNDNITVVINIVDEILPEKSGKIKAIKKEHSL